MSTRSCCNWRPFLMVLLIIAAGVGGYLAHSLLSPGRNSARAGDAAVGARPEGDDVVEAKVWVRKRQQTPPPVGAPDPASESYIATHALVIRSRIILAEAVKHRDLDKLKSLAGKDPVKTIAANLWVTVEPGTQVL